MSNKYITPLFLDLILYNDHLCHCFLLNVIHLIIGFSSFTYKYVYDSLNVEGGGQIMLTIKLLITIFVIFAYTNQHNFESATINESVEDNIEEIESKPIIEDHQESIDDYQEPIINEPDPSPVVETPKKPNLPLVNSDAIPKDVHHLLNQDIGFVYHNLTTNERISYNEKSYFYAASTPKPIIAMLLFDVGLDLSTEVVRQAHHVQSGRGTITNYGANGQVYLLEEVLYEMIVSSDNTATQMAYSVGKPYQASKHARNYSNSSNPTKLFNGENLVTPEYMADAMTYLHYNKDYYQYVLDLMFLAPDQMNLFNNIPEYAKKPGRSSFRNSHSQIGLIYEEDPFVFVIYAQNSRTIEDMQVIADSFFKKHLANE